MTSHQPVWRVLPIFLVLAFALSEYPWLLHTLGYSGNPNPNPLGLLLAALIASAVDRGWRGPVSLLASIVRVRVLPVYWLAAIGIPVAALAAALAIAFVQGIPVQPRPPDWSDLIDRFLIALVFVGLGEEPAWRGFLQPLLQRRLSAFLATIGVSVVWAVWHLPLMGTEFAWNLVPAFLVSLCAGAFVLAWLYNATGSVLLPILTHAAINTAGPGYVFPLVSPGELPLFWWIYAFVWSVAAVLVIAMTRGRLGVMSPRS